MNYEMPSFQEKLLYKVAEYIQIIEIALISRWVGKLSMSTHRRNAARVCIVLL